ncbi:hypothetical protein B0533_06125 [Sedimentibacter sp. SX930]|nr:hypothetical protein B0533_06125 [Sedimentibacter sp. SX930]
MIGKKALAVLQTGLIFVLAGCGASFDGKANSEPDSEPAYIDRLVDIVYEVNWTEETLLGLTLGQWGTITGHSYEIDGTLSIYENKHYTDTVMIRTELVVDELTTAIIGGLYLNAVKEANPEMPINAAVYDFGTGEKTILKGHFGQLSSGKLTEMEDLFLTYLIDFQTILNEARDSESGSMDSDEFIRYKTMYEYFTYQLDSDLLLEINDSDYIQDQINKAFIELISRGLTKDA